MYEFSGGRVSSLWQTWTFAMGLYGKLPKWLRLLHLVYIIYSPFHRQNILKLISSTFRVVRSMCDLSKLSTFFGTSAFLVFSSSILSHSTMFHF